MRKRRLAFITFFIALCGTFGFVKASLAATDIFYSVGQTTSSLMTSSPTLTITNGAGVFSVAQTGNIGVGDKVTYNSGQIAYLAGKTNSDDAHWTLITATGGAPTDANAVSVTSITRAFTSLASAIGSSTDSNHLNTSNLVSGNYTLNIPCYFDSGPDTVPVTLAPSWITGPNNYLRIYTPTSTTTEVNQNQRAHGVWDNSKYRLEMSNQTYAIQDQGVAYLKVDGLQFKIAAMNQADFLFWMGDAASYQILNDVEVSNSIFQGLLGNTNQQAGIIAYESISNSSTLSTWNNILYNFKASGSDNSSGAFIISDDTLEWHAYNNTVYNSDRGYWDIPSNGFEASALIFNNIAQETTYFGYETIPNTSGFNISDLNDAPGLNSKSLTTVAFVSTSTSDFHLASSDTAGFNAGTDLNFSAGSHQSDNFNRADGALGSNWTKPPASESNLIVASNSVMEDVENTHAYAYWSADSFDSNQYSQATIGTLGAWNGVVARVQAGDTDRFYLAFAFGGGDGRLYVRYDGSYTQLLQATTTFWSSGDTIRIEAVGVNPVHLSLWKNNSLVAAYDDTTYLIEGGSPGIGLFSPSGQGLSLDNWEGGDVGSSTTGSDIDHQARPCGSTWDIGADEYCPPLISAFLTPATATSTTIIVNTFTSDDDGGDIAGYLLTETSSTPAFGSGSWVSTIPTSYTFASPGTKTLFAWVKDNENISASATSSIVVDTTAPTVTAFTIPSSGSSLTVSVMSFTATDDVGVTGYLLTESATPPSLSDPGWSSAAPSAYTFSSYGTKILYAWARDAAGNISSSASQSIVLSPPQSNSSGSAGGSGGSIPPPSAPLDLLYTVTSSSSSMNVDLIWSPPLTHYLNLSYSIYRNGIEIGTSSALSYADRNISLSSSSSYTYAVAATDESGFTSGYSNTVHVSFSVGTSSTATAPAALLEQLTSLLKALLAKQAGSITKTLHYGSRGSDVTALQQFLIISADGPAAQALAHYGATGFFGTFTKDALIEFQKTVGVKPASGIFGPITKKLLSPTVRLP